MRKIYLLAISVCFATLVFAQNANQVSIHAKVFDTAIPTEARNFLETKMQRILTTCDIVDDGTERFLMTARINIISKDIAPTTPVRISQKMELTFLVGDVVDNKLYESYTIELSGIGTTEAKAFISAFQRVNVNNPQIHSMLAQAQIKIIDYYTNHCDDMISKANSLANQQKFDEAIYYLMSIPNVCSACYSCCQTIAENVYKKKLSAEGKLLLNKAQNEWLSGQNMDSANRAFDILSQIDPQSSEYPKVMELQKSITAKLLDDEKRAWQLKVQEMEGRRKSISSIIDCVKSIGVSWANHRPESVVRNTVNKWY